MTHIMLLEALKAETLDATRDLLLPVAMQKGDAEEPADRAPEVFLMRLPDSGAARKKAPYILHQFLTSKDDQPSGEEPACVAVVRTIFCTYHSDEQQGALALLNMMERLRIQLLRKVAIGDQFTLDRSAGVEMLVYPEDTAPYFAGEMVTTWSLPAVEREVRTWL